MSFKYDTSGDLSLQKVRNMRLLIGLILLAFPIAELMLLVSLGHRYGWWLILYLVVIAYLGLQLIRGEKQLMTAKMMRSMQFGESPISTMMGSARNMIAGILLILPGVMSDVIAAILLLIPMKKSKVNVSEGTQEQTNNQTTYHTKHQYDDPANDDIIEGEYTEIKEPDNPDNK